MATPICSGSGSRSRVFRSDEECLDGWPERHAIEPALKPYWKVQGELSVHNNLLLFQNCIVVPGFLQQQTLEKLYHAEMPT